MSDITKPKQTGLSATQEKLQATEDYLLTLPQLDPQTEHFIADGIYLRKITIPQGAAVTGAVHLTETLDIMIYGDLTVVTEKGKRRITKAGTVFVSPPGLKKVAYANKETVWITAHAVSEIKNKTLEEIEKELWVENYRDYSNYLEHREDN